MGETEQNRTQEKEDEVKAAKEEMRELEQADELPDKLEDWPDGKAKYETLGGPESESGYEDGATEKLGPADLRHHEDGSVSIGGEKVDDPDEYKGEPIPGGPTDPNAPEDIGVTKTSIEREQEENGHGAEGEQEENGASNDGGGQTRDDNATDEDSDDQDAVVEGAPENL